jgi:phospho-N-acetylmuramoyl-pentapeptide-transferase
MISLMTSGGVALWLAVLTTPVLIRWLVKHNIGQQIREDGPQVHISKAGTPTMGGIGIVGSVIVGYGVAHAIPGETISPSGLLVMLAVLGAALIGFADDWIKVRHRRSLGLNKRAKFGSQIALGLAFALLAVYWAHASTTLSFTRYNSFGIHLGTVVWVVWATVIIAAAANAVNLTDGLDGLAAGSSTFCFACLAIIGYWQYRHFSIYHVGIQPTDALDLALASVALAGACLGFLWWNAAPAKIFMGDTGSLSIGSGLAALCLLMNLDLLLAVIGGLFVIVTLSVVIQVISFRLFHRRVFRMAPLHHHFELVGWPETTVIVRFWILAGLFAALGLGIFYGDFLSVSKLT